MEHLEHASKTLKYDSSERRKRSSTQSDTVTRNIPERVVSLKDLPYIPWRKFKVQGGQIGDHSSDINYNSVCGQIEEGLKDGFTDAQIVRGVN